MPMSYELPPPPSGKTGSESGKIRARLSGYRPHDVLLLSGGSCDNVCATSVAVTNQLEEQLQRWTDAGIIDAQAASRIREHEAAREAPGVRWPVILAIVFGALMVGAGVLLFVAAHWDELSSTRRFLLLLGMIAGFHIAAGVFMPRMRALGIALHAIGTIALGGGIFLAAEIFNLEEHWPSGILLWAIGAVLTWVLLRDWPQATISALLIPAWIASEWIDRTSHYLKTDRIVLQFLAMLAITYLSARHGDEQSAFRRALVWIGGIALLPSCIALAVIGHGFEYSRVAMPLPINALGVSLALGLPLLVALLLRGKAAIWNAGYALWVFILPHLDGSKVGQNVALHGVCALGACGLVYWGLEERRRERINLGVAGFAITLIMFYFSEVMGKLGRSASLVGFGLLFLIGGWQLERLRRKLIARTKGATA